MKHDTSVERESGVDAKSLQQGLEWCPEARALARGAGVHEGDVGDVLVARFVDVGLARQVPPQSPLMFSTTLFRQQAGGRGDGGNGCALRAQAGDGGSFNGGEMGAS